MATPLYRDRRDRAAARAKFPSTPDDQPTPPSSSPGSESEPRASG
jgi:hypothetical protein